MLLTETYIFCTSTQGHKSLEQEKDCFPLNNAIPPFLTFPHSLKKQRLSSLKWSVPLKTLLFLSLCLSLSISPYLVSPKCKDIFCTHFHSFIKMNGDNYCFCFYWSAQRSWTRCSYTKESIKVAVCNWISTCHVAALVILAHVAIYHEWCSYSISPFWEN